MRAQLTGPAPAGASGGGDADPVTAHPTADCQTIADTLHADLVLFSVVFAVALVILTVGALVLVRHRRRREEADRDPGA